MDIYDGVVNVAGTNSRHFLATAMTFFTYDLWYLPISFLAISWRHWWCICVPYYPVDAVIRKQQRSRKIMRGPTTVLQTNRRFRMGAGLLWVCLRNSRRNWSHNTFGYKWTKTICRTWIFLHFCASPPYSLLESIEIAHQHHLLAFLRGWAWRMD